MRETKVELGLPARCWIEGQTVQSPTWQHAGTKVWTPLCPGGVKSPGLPSLPTASKGYETGTPSKDTILAQRRGVQRAPAPACAPVSPSSLPPYSLGAAGFYPGVPLSSLQNKTSPPRSSCSPPQQDWLSHHLPHLSYIEASTTESVHSQIPSLAYILITAGA